MSRSSLVWQSTRTAFVIGSVLALYSSLTTFRQIHHELWLIGHNLLIILSFLLVMFIGAQYRMLKGVFKFMLLTVAIYFSVIMLLYIGSYIITTTFFVEKLAWIPFFYHDYNYHGFKSVVDYLNHKNNFRELLELQIFSFLISSVLYVAAGSLGYGAGPLIARLTKLSSTV